MGGLAHALVDDARGRKGSIQDLGRGTTLELTDMYRVLGTDPDPDTALTDELTPGVICRRLASERGQGVGAPGSVLS